MDVLQTGSVMEPVEWWRIYTTTIELAKGHALVASVWPSKPAANYAASQGAAWFLDERRGDKTTRLNSGTTMTTETAKIQAQAALMEAAAVLRKFATHATPIAHA